MTGVSDIQEAVAQIKAAGPSKPRLARDPVNQPMINNWVEAIGDRNPIYVDDAAARAAGHPGIVAPPAMIQVWTMMGLGGVRPKDDPLGPIIKLFDDAGYIGVVATNCEQTYHRYLLPGSKSASAPSSVTSSDPSKPRSARAGSSTSTSYGKSGTRTSQR